MAERSRILFVEDAANDAELAARELKRAGLVFEWRRVETEPDYRSAIREFDPHVILSDFSMPHFDGMEALRMAVELCPDVPFIFVSGTLGEEYAVRALKNGATDYVLKTNLIRLPAAIERAMREAKERVARNALQREVRDSEQRFRQLAENIRDVFWMNAVDTRETLYISPAYEQVWGRSLEQVEKVHAHWAQSIHPEDRAKVFAAAEELMAGTGAFDLEYRVVRPDGSTRWIHDRGFPVRDAQGRTYRTTGIAEDITERKLAEQKIARLSRIQSVLGGINSAIVRIRDRQLLLQEACRIAVENGGFRMAWIGMVDESGKKLEVATWSGFENGFFDICHRLSLEAGTFEGEGMPGRAVRGRRPVVANDIAADPDVHYKKEHLDRGYRAAIVLPLLAGEQPLGVLAMYVSEPNFFDDDEIRLLLDLAGDVSFAMEYFDKEEKLEYLAYYDALTGLPNTTLFHDRLTQFLNSAKRSDTKTAVILVNLDRFRHLNETLGRHAGDLALKTVAQRIRQALPESSTVARTTADTFAIAMADVKHVDEVVDVLKGRVFGLLGQSLALDANEVRLSATAGIALYPSDGSNHEALFGNAEAALKQAKNSGSKYLFYAPEMNARVAEKLTLETKLRLALEREEFVLYYQPKVDLSSGSVTGLEALIRWNDPQSGLVLPASFIPILEETGMILEVGTWAIHRALEDCRRWQEKGLKPPRVAVNVSALQLRQKNFVDVLRHVLQGHKGSSLSLDLEITESLVMEDIEGNAHKFAALRNLGIDIAIDDFGTGYSSLSYLAKLPVSALKIDRSFVHSMTGSRESATIVSMIVSLAHSLKLKVIAEGVETQEQLAFLERLRCDELQGYLVSRPIPPERLRELFAPYSESHGA
jgi:diguanylate cyclase (GGDEF)-like protein/PAS domain S-box-containing protein